MDYQQLLKDLYYSSDVGLLGKTKFKLKVKQLHPKIPNKVIDEFVNKQTLQQVNTSKKKQFKGFYKIVAPPRCYQMDIFFMNAFKRSNEGQHIFMIFVDILSKKMFVYPMNNQTTDEIISIIKQFMDKHEVRGLESDEQFNIKPLIKLCEDKEIYISTDVAKEDHFSAGNRLGIVDAGVRTIKKYITNYMISKNTTTYVDKLQSLVNNYNTTPHSSIRNKTPNDVYDDIDFQKKLQQKLEEKNAELDDNINLNIGDFVRKTQDKNIFDKASIIYSPEIYVIYDIVGNKYVLIDQDEKILKRKYKYFELLRVDEKEVEGKESSTENIDKDRKRHSNITKILKDNDTRSYQEVDKALDEVPKLREKTTKMLRSGKTFK